MKGQLKCSKHRNFANQLESLRSEYHVTEKDLQRIFALSPMKINFLRDEDEEEIEEIEIHESAEESATRTTPHHAIAENKNDTSVTDISSLMSFQVRKTAAVTPPQNKGPPAIASSVITPDAPKSISNGHVSRSFSHDGPKSKFEGLFVHSSDADTASIKNWAASMSPRSSMIGGEMPLFATNSLAAAMEAISFTDPMQTINPMVGMSVVDVSDTDFYDEHFTLRFKGDEVRLGEGGLMTFVGIIASRKRQEYVAVRGWPKRMMTNGAPGLNALTSAMNAAVGSSTTSVSSSSSAAVTELKMEIKALRMLAKRSPYIASIWHRGLLTLPPSLFHPTFIATETECVVMESSVLGNLDTLFESALLPPQGLTIDDIKGMCIQLMDGLIDMHQAGIMHRSIHPKNILISQYASNCLAGRVVFLNGYVLKWTNFTPASVLSIVDPLGTFNMRDLWSAPEVSIDARKNTGQNHPLITELWPLGLIYYYIATNGQQPFQSFDEAMEAYNNGDFRGRYLDRHDLQKKLPMLFDLIERLIRPVANRVELSTVRCHPFFWTMERRKNLILYFADSFLIRGSELINHFIVTFDKICLLFVFGDKGWVPSLRTDLLQLVPLHLRTDEKSMSGSHLLHAIKAVLQQPDMLAMKLIPKLPAGEAVLEFIRQMTELEFPRLLILLYELGSTHGKWSWDGDEVQHTWNKSLHPLTVSR